MAPYFETIKSFADVQISDEGVNTVEFLEASDGLVQLFDLLGSAIFGFVQADLKSNLAGVRERYNACPDKSGTLESLVECELQEKVGQYARGTHCLVLFLRGLAFTGHAMQTLKTDTKSELHICFKRSYDKVLKQHHPLIVRAAVSVAIRAAPRRPDFYARISQGGDMQKFDEMMTRWIAGMDAIVKRMKSWIEPRGYGRI